MHFRLTEILVGVPLGIVKDDPVNGSFTTWSVGKTTSANGVGGETGAGGKRKDQIAAFFATFLLKREELVPKSFLVENQNKF